MLLHGLRVLLQGLSLGLLAEEQLADVLGGLLLGAVESAVVLLQVGLAGLECRRVGFHRVKPWLDLGLADLEGRRFGFDSLGSTSAMNISFATR